MTKIVVVAPVKLRRLKNSKSTSGLAVRRSTTAKATKRRDPATSRAMIAGEPQPQVAPWISARVIAVEPGDRQQRARDVHPPRRRGVARLRRRAQRQDDDQDREGDVDDEDPAPAELAGEHAADEHPDPETSSVAAPHMPIANPRRSPVKTFVSSDIDAGISIAPPIPESAIPAISSCTSRRRGGDRRPAGEQDRAADQHPAAAEDVGEPAGRDQERRERDVERGHRPLQLGQRGVELGVDRRQGDDDRRRRQLHDPGCRDHRDERLRPGDERHAAILIRAAGRIRAWISASG